MRQTLALLFVIAAIASFHALQIDFPWEIPFRLQGNEPTQVPITPGVAVKRSWLDEQDHTGPARGFAPFLKPDYTYPVYRNVQAYGAVGNGQHDDTDALQDAINSDGNGGSRYQNEVTTRPAEVFVPGGEYKISKTVDLRLNTILVGDPNDPPVFKASSGFRGGPLINGVDFVTDNTGGTTNFLVAIKNVVIDTKNIGKDQSVIALNWGVAQACQLTNIRIEMPNNFNGHIGIAIDRGSTTAVTDVVGFSYYLFGCLLLISLLQRKSVEAPLESVTVTSSLISKIFCFNSARLQSPLRVFYCSRSGCHIRYLWLGN